MVSLDIIPAVIAIMIICTSMGGCILLLVLFLFECCLRVVEAVTDCLERRRMNAMMVASEGSTGGSGTTSEIELGPRVHVIVVNPGPGGGTRSSEAGTGGSH